MRSVYLPPGSGLGTDYSGDLAGYPGHGLLRRLQPKASTDNSGDLAQACHFLPVRSANPFLHDREIRGTDYSGDLVPQPTDYSGDIWFIHGLLRRLQAKMPTDYSGDLIPEATDYSGDRPYPVTDYSGDATLEATDYLGGCNQIPRTTQAIGPWKARTTQAVSAENHVLAGVPIAPLMMIIILFLFFFTSLKDQHHAPRSLKVALRLIARRARNPLAAAYTCLIGASENKRRAVNAPAEDKVIAGVLRAALTGLTERAAQLRTLKRHVEADAEVLDITLLTSLVAGLDAGMLSEADLQREIDVPIQGGASTLGAVMQGLKATGKTYDGATASRLARVSLQSRAYRSFRLS